MRHLPKIIGILVLSVMMYACGSSSLKNPQTKKEEPVVIANDSLEYEVIIFDIGFNNYLASQARPIGYYVIIFDIGFNNYLASQARPIGYYSQNYLENWNVIYVTNWNIRAQNPTRYNQDIYQNVIDYSSSIDYGMDVNYKLFNYFQFAQQKYKMRLDNEAGTNVRIR